MSPTTDPPPVLRSYEDRDGDPWLEASTDPFYADYYEAE